MWNKIILTKVVYLSDVSTVEEPSPAAYEQKYIKLSNYNCYTKFVTKYSNVILVPLDIRSTVSGFEPPEAKVNLCM